MSFCLLYVLLLLPCAAQQLALNDWQRVHDLQPGSHVLVRTMGGENYHGRVLSVSVESMTIESDERSHLGRITRQRELRRETVREVRLLHSGASVLTGAAIGAAVGAGIGLAIDSSERSHEDGHLVTVVFTLLGGAVGAGIGRHFALVRGKTIYLAP
jgi:hypothetical protein